jgi:hypothetical protein
VPDLRGELHLRLLAEEVVAVAATDVDPTAAFAGLSIVADALRFVGALDDRVVVEVLEDVRVAMALRAHERPRGLWRTPGAFVPAPHVGPWSDPETAPLMTASSETRILDVEVPFPWGRAWLSHMTWRGDGAVLRGALIPGHGVVDPPRTWWSPWSAEGMVLVADDGAPFAARSGPAGGDDAFVWMRWDLPAPPPVDAGPITVVHGDTRCRTTLRRPRSVRSEALDGPPGVTYLERLARMAVEHPTRAWGDPELDAAVASALVAAGALDPCDPIISTLEAVRGKAAGGDPPPAVEGPATGIAALPADWRQALAATAPGAGRPGHHAIGVALPVVDGFEVELAALRTTEDDALLEVVVRPGRSRWSSGIGHDQLTQPGLSLLVVDDVGRWYTPLTRRTGVSPSEVEAQLCFGRPVDPGVRVLTFVVTSRDRRFTCEVPIGDPT